MAEGIEEAWAEVAEACWWNTRVSSRVQNAAEDEEQAFVNAEKDAARALAQAALDGAHSHEGLYRCNCTTWAEGDRCREYKIDRTKIEALGKEAE